MPEKNPFVPAERTLEEKRKPAEAEIEKDKKKLKEHKKPATQPKKPGKDK